MTGVRVFNTGSGSNIPPPRASMTDTDYLLLMLSDGRWHSQADILFGSQQERGYGMTVHSRASDLRKRGHVIECEVRSDTPRRQSFYRLVAPVEVAA